LFTLYLNAQFDGIGICFVVTCAAALCPVQFEYRVLMFALVAHLAFAVWIFGNPETITSGPVNLGSTLNAYYQKYVIDVTSNGADSASGSTAGGLGTIVSNVLIRATVFPAAALLLVVCIALLLGGVIARLLGGCFKYVTLEH
jgi:hypothetical protein